MSRSSWQGGGRSRTPSILMPAWGSAQEEMSRVQQGRCSQDVPGDTHRSLSVRNQFSHVTFKHVLLPIWIAAYRYRGQPYQFLVNGQTGEVVGKAPWSVWKISLAVIAAVLVIATISYLYYQYEESRRPPAGRCPAFALHPAGPRAAGASASMIGGRLAARRRRPLCCAPP